MRIQIVAVGKLKAGPERELYARHAERISAAGRSVGLGPLDLVEIAEGRAPAVAARMTDEATRLLARCAGADVRVVLDERGTPLSSQAFADMLRRFRDRSCANLAVLIGGPDGHGADARAAADVVVSLSAMTLPHGLARIVLAEQIYRAITIAAGHPYHRA